MKALRTLMASVGTVAVVGLSVVAPPAQAATPRHYCPGVTDQWTGLEYEFSEPAGSQVFHANTGSPRTDLHVAPGYPPVSANGSTVGFNNNSVLVSNGVVMNPGYLDFTMCTKFTTGDHDSMNLVQMGHSGPPALPVVQCPASGCMIKETPWYGQVMAVGDRFRENTGVDNIAGDGKYHEITLARRGSVFSVYFDGVLKQRDSHPNTGPIDIISPLEVGGKYTKGSITSSHDLCLCRIAHIWMSAR